MLAMQVQAAGELAFGHCGRGAPEIRWRGEGGGGKRVGERVGVRCLRPLLFHSRMVGSPQAAAYELGASLKQG
jgi:hypothetical protein